MNKTFDCVEMKHKGADRIRKKIGKLTAEEELQFWKKMTASLIKHKMQISEKHKVEAYPATLPDGTRQLHSTIYECFGGFFALAYILMRVPRVSG